MRRLTSLSATLLASAAALVATATPACAGQVESGLPEREGGRGDIVVTATLQSSATSATKTSTPIIESPQSISIISREEIDLRASPTIADALSYTAGVYVEPYGGDSRTDEVWVRGFGAGGFSANNSFVDGLRISPGGQWTRPGFDPFALQQIEVLKGPSGALYGQTAPGGVVNIVSKRPTFAPRGEVLLQGVGFNDLGRWNHQAAADVSGPLSDKFAVRMVALARYGGSQLRDTDLSRQYLAPSITWQPSDDTSWTVLAQYQRDEGESTFQYLPRLGTLLPTNGGYIENDANLGEPDWNQFDRNQYLVGSFVEHRFGDTFTFRNNTRYTKLDTLYRGVLLLSDTLSTPAACTGIAGCIVGQTVLRRATQGVGESEGIATDTQVEARFGTGPIRHTLLAGFDYFHTEWQHYRDVVPNRLVLPTLDIFNPVPRGSAGFAEAATPAIYLETVTKQYGVYLQDQIELGRLRVTIGGRHDWADDDTNNVTSPAAPRRFLTDSKAFTWRAGGVYLFDNGLAPYASYAESFQPQVSDPSTSLGGVPFVPTTGQQYEAGIRFQRGRNIYVTLGAYQITQQNIVTPAPIIPPATVPEQCGLSICQVQTGEGRVRGIELESKASLPWGMAMIATASHSDGEVTRSNVAGQVGRKLTLLPEILASLFVDQRLRDGALEGLGLGGGVRYIGKSWGDANNTLRIPDYAQFDVFVRYDFGANNPALRGLTASINGRNIADKRFVASCTSAVACAYGQGRSVTARLDFRW